MNHVGLVSLGLVFWCVFPNLGYGSLFITGLVFLCFCIIWSLFGCCLVVVSSAIDCLERLVSEMTCYVLLSVA